MMKHVKAGARAAAGFLLVFLAVGVVVCLPAWLCDVFKTRWWMLLIPVNLFLVCCCGSWLFAIVDAKESEKQS